MKRDDSFLNRTLFDSDSTRAGSGQSEAPCNKQINQLSTDLSSEVDRMSNQQLLLNQKNSRHAFSNLKELCGGWIGQFSFRPTPINTIFGVTVYFVAICSTLKKREGDTWLNSVLRAKLPGYSRLYQELSWESLRNSLLSNPYPLSTQHRDVCGSAGEIQKLDHELLREHTPDTAHTQFYNRNDQVERIKFVDLHKEKAFIYLRSPWDKQIQKDFVGLFPDRVSSDSSNQKISPLDRAPDIALEEDTDNPVLAWHRIAVLRRPSQAVLATSEVRERNTALNSAESNRVRERRERNQLVCNKSKSSCPLAQETGIVSQTGFRSTPDPVPDKIVGLEYILPLKASRQRVYAESDTIPLKLESAYPARALSIISDWDRREPILGEDIPLLSDISRRQTTLRKLKEEKNRLLAMNSQLFWGQSWHSLQHKSRQLFYLYGFSPPNSLTQLLDQRPMRSERGNQAVLQETYNHSFERKEGLHVSKTALMDQGNQTTAYANGNTLLGFDQSPHSVHEGGNFEQPVVTLNSQSNHGAYLHNLMSSQSFTESHEDETLNTPSKLARSPLQNWPLLANASSFAQESGMPLNNFHTSSWIVPRLMSGYKFPDCTRDQTSSLFQNFVLRQLLVRGSIDFSHQDLISQVVLRPLYVQLPPALPLSFFKNLASFLSSSSSSNLTGYCAPNSVASAFVGARNGASTKDPAQRQQAERRIPPSDASILQKVPRYSDIRIEYRPTSLEELTQVQDAFLQLGKDFKSYLDLPKESPPAIKIAPSVEDEKLFELEANNSERGEDMPDTVWGSLQKIREREERFELGKEFRPFTYQNIYGYRHDSSGEKPCFEEKQRSANNLRESDTPLSALTDQENSWIRSRLGPENMLSDRKYNFFGRKHLLTKRLVAQEEKEINDQLFKRSFCTPACPDGSDELNNQAVSRPLVSKKLQRRARKQLIKILGAPTLSARNAAGSQNRTQKPNRSLRGTIKKTAYSHLRWQKKRFASRVLTTPSKRHLVLPEISRSDWAKMLKWQLKNYFFLEEKRLQKLQKRHPDENLKLKRVHIYLPWVTVRTPSDKPFQWPLTRLDCAADAGASLKAKAQERSYSLPAYETIQHWNCGESASLSLRGSKLNRLDLRSNGIRESSRNESHLFQMPSGESWLLVYRLFLAFALKNVLKYIYRVSVKSFLIQTVNSDLGLMTTSPQFREWLEHGPPKPFYTPEKRLRDVAGIQDNIPILSEIVWYLRNSGRGRSRSRGLLLVGPSGAEKASLVQAIAGECRRPIIVQSLSALALTDDNPYEQLENLFKMARQQAPCVLFFDDLDVIGKSRDNVVTSDLGAQDLLFSLDSHTAEGRLCLANVSHSIHTTLLSTPGRRGAGRHSNWNMNPLLSNPVIQPDLESLSQDERQGGTSVRAGGGALALAQDSEDFKRRRLNLMLRLLTEMDGSLPFNGVVIVATSERPALLDPALLRAGRFDRRIHLSLPNQERRIQLFKRETQKIGHMQSMPWEYLGVRTTNMSVADISAAINHSAIRAILDNTVHTVETLEHGLDCVTGVSKKTLSPNNLQQSDPFHLSRLAFYQAGKAVVHNLLLDHPELGICSLNDAAANLGAIADPYNITRESVQVLQSNCSSSAAELVREQLSPASILKRKGRGGRGSGVLSHGSFKARAADNSVHPKLSSTHRTHKKGSTFSARTRVHFETRLVGLYAGKAAELLYISSASVSEEFVRGSMWQPTYTAGRQEPARLRRKSNRSGGWLWQSNLGFSELLRASSLIHLMVDRWYLYSERVFTYKINKLVSSLNHEQIRNETLFPLGKRLSRALELDAIKPNFWGIAPTINPNGRGVNVQEQENEQDGLESTSTQIYQERIRARWWQAKICQALEMRERPYGKWYRIYLPKAEERERNEEWVPPDRVFHQSFTLSNLAIKQLDPKNVDVRGSSQMSSYTPLHNKTRQFHFIKLNLKGASSTAARAISYKTLNDLYLFERDRAYQNAVMNCFYTAFNLLNENRELLDMFADHLMRYQIVRSHEISKICSFFSSTHE